MEVCPFFGLCGGCEFQDIPFEEYLKMKMQKVQEALAHKAIQAPIEPIISIPEGTRRRVNFSYGSGKFGFNERKSHRLIDITSCRLLVPELQNLILPLKELSQKIGGTGHVAVLMTDIGADIAYLTDSSSSVRGKRKKKIRQNIETLNEISFFCQTHPIVRFILDTDLLFQAVQISAPSNVFLQPSVLGEEILVKLILKEVQKNQHVLDLFCGQGTFTIPLHEAGILVKGYDITASSIEFLKKCGIKAEVRDLFRHPLEIEELTGLDVVILDPARSGASAVCEKLAQSPVAKIIMVSCNPGTFARDARTLINGGYFLKKVTPIDQFIFSRHIELISIFKR